MTGNDERMTGNDAGGTTGDADMTISDALKYLFYDGAEGRAEWNAWIDRQGEIDLTKIWSHEDYGLYNLTGVDFSGKYFESVKFCGCILRGAKFVKTDLRSVDFFGATLSMADLTGADLRRSNLRSARVMGATLTGADLRGADLTGAQFRHTDLSCVKFQYDRVTLGDITDALKAGAPKDPSGLGGAKLTGADFTGAILKDVNLKGFDLSGSNFKGASLEGADLRNVKGLLLDDTFVRNAQFSPAGYLPWKADPWTQLCESYTGARLFFNLLLLFGFLVPLAAKVLFWFAVHESQASLEAAAIPVRDEVSQLRRELERHPECMPATIAAERIENLVSSPDIPHCLGMECQERSVISVLLGFDGREGWWLPTFSIILLLYNVLRAIMTRFVSAMRDSEMRSGWSPVHDRKFKILSVAHYVTWILGQIALASFLIHTWWFLTSRLWVPW